MLTFQAFYLLAIITGDTFRLNLLLVTKDKKLVLKLTVGFETNVNNNSRRKKDKYQELLQALNPQFSSVKFGNLSCIVKVKLHFINVLRESKVY